MSAFCNAFLESLLFDNVSFKMVCIEKYRKTPTNPEDKKCNNNLIIGLNL